MPISQTTTLPVPSLPFSMWNLQFSKENLNEKFLSVIGDYKLNIWSPYLLRSCAASVEKPAPLIFQNCSFGFRSRRWKYCVFGNGRVNHSTWQCRTRPSVGVSWVLCAKQRDSSLSLLCDIGDSDPCQTENSDCSQQLRHRDSASESVWK